MKNKLLNRLFLYLFGLFLLAMGTITSVWSNLGVAATTSAGYAMSIITGLSLGTFTLIFFAVFVFGQIVLYPKEKYPSVFLQIPISLVFSWLIDFLSSRFYFEFTGVVSRVICLLISFLVTGLGAYLTIRTNIAPTPPDGIVEAISEKSKYPLGTVKNLFDILNVFIAVILLLIYRHGVPGIGIGTLLCSLAVGRMLDFCVKYLDGFMEKLCG